MKIFNNIVNTNYASRGQKPYKAPVLKSGTAEEVGIKFKNVMNSPYLSNVKLGDLLNSGFYANVYKLVGWENSLVARVMKDKEFKPELIKAPVLKRYDIIGESQNKEISIQKRVIGEPLYGKYWTHYKPFSLEEFYKTTRYFMKQPNKFFQNYIQDVINIRKNGFNIDHQNPNNFLLDKKNKCINFVDLSPNYSKIQSISIKDFYPFLDSERIISLIYQNPIEERAKVVDIVRKFLDRMISIAKKSGISIEMEKVDMNQFQDFIVHVYHNNKEVIYKQF